MYDRHQRRWSSFEQAVEPYRLEIARDDFQIDQVRLLLLRLGAPSLFDVARVDGKVELSPGHLLKNQKDYALILDGFISRSGSEVIYAGKYEGVLAAFSNEGELRYLMQSISPPTPPSIKTQSGQTWVQHGPLVASLALATDAGAIYLLTRRTSDLRVRSVLDIYGVTTGRYRCSYALPPDEKWTSVAVSDDALFAASDDSITSWPVNNLCEPRSKQAMRPGRRIVEFRRSADPEGGAIPAEF